MESASNEDVATYLPSGEKRRTLRGAEKHLHPVFEDWGSSLLRTELEFSVHQEFPVQIQASGAAR